VFTRPSSFYYYFYEGSREAILARRPKGASQGLSTFQSMLAGASHPSRMSRRITTANFQTGTIAGSVTTILVNPLWVIQTTQAVQTMPVNNPSSSTEQPKVAKKMNIIETIRFLIRKGGFSALWRGVGPALVLVLNPIIQVRIFLRPLQHTDPKCRPHSILFLNN
jgi:adenine nucleotide transporter 17